jgi:hypothetical protein
MDEYISLREPICLSSDLLAGCNLSNLGEAIILGPNIIYHSKSSTFYLPDLHMVGELSRIGISSNFNTFKYTVTTNEVVLTHKAIFIGSGVDFLFYESLIYTLAKINFIANLSPIDKGICFILNENMSKKTRDFFSQYLLHEFPFSKVFLASTKYRIVVDDLSVVSINGAQAISEIHSARNLALVMSLKFADNSKSYDKIFLLRNSNLYYDLNWRKPINSFMVEAAAWLFGFKLVDPSQISVQKAMTLFQQAKKIVSYHGGGLTNIIFSSPGTKIVELHSEWMDDCFRDLCEVGTLDYTEFFFKMNKFNVRVPRRIARFLGKESVKEIRYWYISPFKFFSIFH